MCPAESPPPSSCSLRGGPLFKRASVLSEAGRAPGRFLLLSVAPLCRGERLAGVRAGPGPFTAQGLGGRDRTPPPPRMNAGCFLSSFPSPCVAFYLSSSMGCKDTVSLLFLQYFTIKFVVVFEVCVASWDHSEPVGAPPTPPLVPPPAAGCPLPKMEVWLAPDDVVRPSTWGVRKRPRCCLEKRRLQGITVAGWTEVSCPPGNSLQGEAPERKELQSWDILLGDLGLPDQGLILLCSGPFWLLVLEGRGGDPRTGSVKLFSGWQGR